MKEIVPKTIAQLKDKLFINTAYDIRAYVGTPGRFFDPANAVLTPEAMRVAGVLMGSMPFNLAGGEIIQLTPGDSVVIGYDNGPTSKALADGFAKGLSEQGITVYNIGLSSSGQVYHNETQLKAQGHVQITRSHVEITTNGAKFAVKGQGIHTYLLGQMNEALNNDTIGRDTDEVKVTDKTEEGLKLYTDKMMARYSDYFAKHPRSVAINLFGGTGLKYKELFEKILENVTIIGDTINVNSGKLLADPTRFEMLPMVPGFHMALKRGQRVHSFDLDADRGSVTEGLMVFELDGTGHYLGDSLAHIVADYKLNIALPALMNTLASKNLPAGQADIIHRIAATVYVDPRYTGGVPAFVEKNGGYVAYHPKGHSLWKDTMTNNMKKLAKLANYTSVAGFVKETNYQDMQIEASLHLFVTGADDGIPRDDAIENVFILEKLFDKLKIKTLAEYFAKLPRRFATKEIRTGASTNSQKVNITKDVIISLKEAFSPGKYTIIEFEGQIRVEWNSGFIMYGMSNTSPKLTFMAEGSTKNERNQALAYILALHNSMKKKHRDKLPLDFGENRFFLEDKSYNLTNPDRINFGDIRAVEFMKKHGLTV